MRFRVDRFCHWHCQCALVVAAMMAQPLWAAPPKVDHLFPAGLQHGQTAQIKVTGKLDDATRVWCSRADVTLKLAKKATLSVTVPVESVAGLCWIRFYNSEGASDLKPFIVGSISEVAEKEPNNEQSTAQLIELTSSIVNGILSKNGDVDTYAIPLRKGQTLVLALEANRRLASPFDGVLQVVSPRGFVLDQNDDDQGLDPRLVFRATEDGTYFVRLFGFPAVANSSVRLSGGASYIYRLMITTDGFVDHAFPLAVTKGETVQIVGWNLTTDIKSFVVGTDIEATSVLLQHQKLANTTEIKLVEHSNLIEKEPNDLANPNELKLPLTVSGTIQNRKDIDVYQFTAKKGQRLEFRIESRALGQLLDPVLRLRDATGKILKQAETRSSTVIDEVLTMTIPADGKYTIAVRDLYGHGGMRYAYRMSISEPVPNFTLSLSADRFVKEFGKPLEFEVKIARLNGFADEIDISILGLPDGITATPVKSLGKGKTAKAIKLKLEGKSAGFNGPIRIIGQSQGKSSVERTANSAITGSKAKTTNIWLTVKPK